MANNFSLTAKLAIVSSVLILISLGLCGLGGVGGQKAAGILFPAGLIALALGVLGFLLTLIVAVIQGFRASRPQGPPPAIAPAPPPRPSNDDPQHGL